MSTTFHELNLNSSLLKALDELGMHTPTPIQEKVFPVAMSGKDVCGIAQTGTGKTFAYLLPCLRLWKFSKDPYPQILIIVPTRELVIQVVQEVKKLCRYMSVVCVGVYGGVNLKPQAAALENGCDVVVGTPGRLMDLALNGSLKTKHIKRLVIDEMDEMLNLGFRTQIKNLLEQLPPKVQNLMFSATITEDVAVLLDEYFREPVRVEAAAAGTPVEQIDQSAYPVPNFYTKINLLQHLLSDTTAFVKVVVFVGSKRLADAVYEALSEQFPDQIGVIHSNKEQNKRFQAVEAFSTGKVRILIATDVVSRGIDISDVSHVINFDLPEEPEQYIHRIGRTGRADKNGNAISFITPNDSSRREQIESLMNRAIPERQFPEEVSVSTELTEDEKPKRFVPNIVLKIPKREDVGPAFHPKKAKNMKVNVKVSHKDKMREKYGKPKKRPPKK